MLKMPPEILGLITGGSLASIQIRRVIKGELPLFGLKQFSAASNIKLEAFDKVMIVVSAVSFLFLVYSMIN